MKIIISVLGLIFAGGGLIAVFYPLFAVFIGSSTNHYMPLVAFIGIVLLLIGSAMVQAAIVHP